MADITHIESHIKQCNLSQLYRLQNYIKKLIPEKKQEQDEAFEKIQKKAIRRISRNEKGNIIHYQLEPVCCGKKECSTCGGNSYKHGPYWYRYFWNGSKWKSEYVGKKLPFANDDIIKKIVNKSETKPSKFQLQHALTNLAKQRQ